MRRLGALVVVGMSLEVPARAATLKVVATTEDLASLTREVGGERVKVQALARGVSDPHFVDANPMLAVKLRGADLLVDVGLDLRAARPLRRQTQHSDFNFRLHDLLIRRLLFSVRTLSIYCREAFAAC